MLKSLQFAYYLGLSAVLCLCGSLFIESYFVASWPLLEGNLNTVDVILLLDRPTLLVLFTVLTISCSAFIYTSEYLPEKDNTRFSWILILFVLSMCLLVLFPLFPAVVLGWDGLGLTSFFLVAYYQNSKARSGAFLTGLSNRVGDCFMLITLGHWQSSLEVVGILLIMVILTKSAQFPYMSWLPAAMAAPTPVSSLVHSSTLVTAGVYLIFRYGGGLSDSDLNLLGVLACFSLILSSLSALFETDMKKVIALSTLSQVSLMLVALSMKLMTLAVVHLIAHAFAKALLFFCAGDAIHVYGTQDLRKVSSGSLSATTKMGVVMATFGIIAVPFFGGAYSKELIISAVLFSGSPNFLAFTLISSVFLTSAYMGRLLYTMCIKKEKEGVMVSKPMMGHISISYIPMFMSLLVIVPMVGVTLGWEPVTSFASDSEGAAPLLGLCFLGLLAGANVQKFLPVAPSSLSGFFSSFAYQIELSTHLFNQTTKQQVLLGRTLDQGWFEVPANNSLLKYLSWMNLVINTKWMPAMICITLISSMYIYLF